MSDVIEAENAEALRELVSEYGEDVEIDGRQLRAFVLVIRVDPALESGGEASDSTAEALVLKSDLPEHQGRRTKSVIRGIEFWLDSFEDEPGFWRLNFGRALRTRRR